MKVTIHHTFDCPDGQTPEHRTLAELEFIPREPDGDVWVLPGTPIAVDSQSSLVFHSAFSQGNRMLSIFVKQRRNGGDTHVFTGMGKITPVPYYAFRLQTGEFIELYFTDAAS